MAEVEILKAMQEQTIASRLGFHEEFDAWLGQHTQIGERDPNATWTDTSYWQDRKDWWVDGITWMSYYRQVQGTMGALPDAVVGESEAEARALLFIEAWLRGLLQVPPENSWLERDVPRLRAATDA